MVIYFSTAQFKETKNVLARYLQTLEWLSHHKNELNQCCSCCCILSGAIVSGTNA